MENLELLKGRNMGSFRKDELIGIKAFSEESWINISLYLNSEDLFAFPRMCAGNWTYVIPKSLWTHLKPSINFDFEEVEVI